MRGEQNVSYKNVEINESSNKVDNETVFHSCSPRGPCFKENSNDLKDNIINISDELNNASTFKDDFKEPCNEAFIDNTVNQLLTLTLIPNLTGYHAK